MRYFQGTHFRTQCTSFLIADSGDQANDAVRILADHRSDNINRDDANEAACLKHRVLQRVRAYRLT